MKKKRSHSLLPGLRAIKPRYFLVLTLVFGIVCVLALRANNEQMTTLRSAVYTADKNNGNVQANLQKLQSYVTAHMNTNLSDGNTSVYPPIQLQYTYERLVEAQGNALQAANGQLYTDAQAYCEKQDSIDFSGHNRVPCIEQYVTSHGEAALPPIPDSLYKFAFVSPRWSPDLAGWSLVVTILAALLTIVSFALNRWHKPSNE